MNEKPFVTDTMYQDVHKPSLLHQIYIALLHGIFRLPYQITKYEDALFAHNQKFATKRRDEIPDICAANATWDCVFLPVLANITQKKFTKMLYSWKMYFYINKVSESQ